MVSPTAIIQIVVNVIVEFLKKFGGPLTAYFVGKKSAEAKQVKKQNEIAKEAAKLDDAVKRADDNVLDFILHD